MLRSTPECARKQTGMPQETLKVLLIEHDPSFARFVEDLLGQAREFSAEVQTVPDVSTGLWALKRTLLDIVLLDIYVPIVAVGDSDDEMVALEAVHAGAQEYLAKSQLSPAWLERSIRYAMERQR